MKCRQSTEITAYLQGEGSEEERAMLRRHFEECESCAPELRQFERTADALGGLGTIEPSTDFADRVQAAFLRAHPQLQRRRRGLLPRLSIAAALLLAAAGGVLLLRPADPGSHLAHVASAAPREEDPEYVFIPKSNRPATVDGSTWTQAVAFDRRLLAALKAERSWDKEIAAAQGWLAARQDADGSWKGVDAYETIELTGLAVLALNGTNDSAVKRGVEFLISRQRDSGAIGGGSPESHAIATLALQEAWLRSGNGEWAKHVTGAVGVIAAQNREGPWGKGPVAAWQYHVLRLAVASGERHLVPTLIHGYDAPGSGLWTDPSPDRDAWAQRVAGLLNRSPIPGTEPVNFDKNDLRLAYFGTTLLRPLEGDAWTKWWSPLRAKLLKAQAADGSWPEGFEPGKGKVYATALSALILQSPQRLPVLAE